MSNDVCLKHMGKTFKSHLNGAWYRAFSYYISLNSRHDLFDTGIYKTNISRSYTKYSNSKAYSENTLDRIEKALTSNKVVNNTRKRQWDKFNNISSKSFQIDTTKIEHLSVSEDELKANGYKHKNPPQLAHGLNKILHHPITIHMLRDYRSGTYNYDQILENIAPECLERKAETENEPLFITPYKDKQLSELAEIKDKRFISSTSSMTSILSQLHFFLSTFRQSNIAGSLFSKNFPFEHCNFSKSAYFPATVILRKKNTLSGNQIISIDSDRSMDREIVLSILGHSLESFLTNNKQQTFTDSYHYSIIDDFLLRSQLDAYDPTLPRYGTFDLKTRAACAIRHDIAYIEKNDNYTGYQMNKIQGEYESLEREFFELIRTTLLKYSLQARIGKMDGIFVAYHNISNIFGFQYLPLEELDFILHSYANKNFKSVITDRRKNLISIYGLEDFILNHERKEREIATKVADTEFKLSIAILRHLIDLIDSELLSLQEWKNCKVIMKAEKPTKSGKTSLNVIVLPLDDNYEDHSIHIKGLSEFEIKRELANLDHKIKENLNANLDKIFGFKVTIAHQYQLNKSSIVLPDFTDSTSQILPEKLKNFVKNQLYQNPYSSYLKTGRETPNFLHPDDVDTWKPHINVTLMNDKKLLSEKYLEYSREKLEALEAQSIVKDAPNQNDKTEIYNRIEKLWRSKGHKGSNKKHTSTDQNMATEFQQILRSYGKRGRSA